MTNRIRIALYSHDTVGLGHTRRQLAIAQAITADVPDTDVLMITGNPEAAQLPRPPRTDLITLPTVMKDTDGSYRPRQQSCGLDEVITMREQVITAALRAYAPHLLVVDKVAAGLCGELRPALRTLSSDRRTRIVLGLREVLDDPTVVRDEWRRAGTAQLIKDFYDELWVYGDPKIFDPIHEYGWHPNIADKINYLGYLGRSWSGKAAPDRRVTPPHQPYVLCQLGGGQDGYPLAEAFVHAEVPAGHRGVVLTGPYLSVAERDRLRIAAGSRVQVHDFVGNSEEFIAGASAVVSMAGYNSTVELLATTVPVLLAPRTTPRTDQLIRAQRLDAAGCVDLLPPEELDPDHVAAWLATAVRRPAAQRSGVDLDGLTRIPESALRLIEGTAHAA